MQPTDITRLVSLGRPTISADGATAVVAASRPDLDANENRSALWLAPTDAATPPRRLTQGDHDSAPRYSPDGRWLAFLRSVGEGKPQLYLLPTAGGEPRQLTDLPGGAGEAVWAPDSTRIAFCARLPEAGRYGQDDDIPAGKEAPRRITGLQYRVDNTGFVLDRRLRVFAVDVTAAEPEPVQLTDGGSDGSSDDLDVAWSADRTRLAFVSARHDDHESDRSTSVFVMSPDGSGLRALTDTSLWLTAPTFSPDGACIVAFGTDVSPDDDGWLGRNDALWRIDLGDGDPRRPTRLTDEESVRVVGDHVLFDGPDVLVLAENRGAVNLLAVPVSGLGGSPGSVRCTGLRQLAGLAGAGGVTVVTYSDAATLGELARLDAGELTPLSDFGSDVAGSLVPITELDASAPDGYPVHGFLAVPTGDGPHPVLLMIHGGPFAQYGWTLLDEAQVYAAAGYAVVFGNPRGSSGYGQAHGRYIVGDVGDRSAPDLLALLDAALERDDLDAARVGVLGGSHGGFMTSWLVGHTDRFAAAVSERAVNAIDSFEGSSDIGWDFADNLYGTDPEQRTRQSPLTYADAIGTPLLIVHSEQDWRCPIEQAQRLYVALRKRRAVVELLVFPGEGHELSRSGVPGHRVARFEAILDWFGRYLR